jgi:hypothetical protein
MALGLTEPPTEISIRNLSGGKMQPKCNANNLTDIYESIFYKMRDPRRLINI